MKNNIEFNYDYLLDKIENKYNKKTMNQNIDALCREVSSFTPLRFKQIVIFKRGYFLQSEIVKISKVLCLNNDELIKSFFSEI